jgi:hypothetical protein
VRSSQKAGLLPLANAPPGGGIPLKSHGGMIAVLSSQLRPAWLVSKKVVRVGVKAEDKFDLVSAVVVR